MRCSLVLLSAIAATLHALTWVNTGDLTRAISVQDLSLGPGGYLYAAASIDTTSGDSGFVYRSTNFFDWTRTGDLPGDVRRLSSLELPAGDTLFAAGRALYSGYDRGTLYYSSDGTNWAYRSQISGTGMGNTITALICDNLGRFQTGSNYMSMSTVYPYYSVNRGVSWTRAATIPFSSDIQCLFQASDNTIWLGSGFGSQLRKSTDNGVNWVVGSAGVSGNYKSDVVEASAGRLYASSWNGAGSPAGYICRSTDYGASWAQVYSSNSYQVRSLCQASDGNVYAGTAGVANTEVLVSTDGGTNWTSAGSLSGATAVYRLLDVNVSGTHYLYAATGPNGDVFRAVLSSVPTKDVGVTRILAPTGTRDSGVTVAPACSVYNFGNTTESYRVRMRIGSLYNDTARVTGHSPGTARYVTLPDWLALERGRLMVRCSTELANDTTPANDRKTDSVMVFVHDVGAVAVVAPAGVIPPGPVSPQATVRNFGNLRELTKVFFRINSGPAYSESVTIGGGLPYTDTTLSFPNWNATAGAYTAVCSTYLPTDQVHANDRVSLDFSVALLDVGVAAILAPTGTLDTAANVIPSARVKNFGAIPAGPFKVFFSIDSGPGQAVYRDSLALAGLAVGDSVTPVFPAWPKPHPERAYTTRCSTRLANDGNPANDTLGGTFTVRARPVHPGWWERAPMPPGPSSKPIGAGAWLAFNRASGLVYGAKGNKTGDFYSYYPSDDSWHPLAPMPPGRESKPPSKGGGGTTDDGSSLYAVKGNNTLGFWQYDIAHDSWHQRRDVPLGVSAKKVKGGTALTWGRKAGVRFLCLLKGYRNEFYRYDPPVDSWTTLAPAPVGANGKWDRGSWMVYDSLNNRQYAHKAKYHEFYYYDVDGDTWCGGLTAMPIPGSGGAKRSNDGACAAYFDECIYALKGGNTQEFWKYYIDGDSWVELETLPKLGSSGKPRKVKGGAAMTATLEALYALKGNKSLEFWQYTPWRMVFAAGALGSTQGVGRVALGDPRMAISPNPLTRGFVTIRLSPFAVRHSPLTLRIYDATGRCVQPAICNLKPEMALDLRGLRPGVYLVRLDADDFISTQKLVVQVESRE